MENKPVFCSQCGARLTAGAAFCASCGAKQAAVLAPDVSAPVQAAPAAAPVNSLAAPKAKLSAFALVMTLLALGATFLAAVLDVAYNIVTFGVSFDAAMRVLQTNGTGMLMAWVAPLLAMVMVLTRKKKLAVIGLILALFSLTMQFLMSIIYFITMMNGGNLAALSFVLRPLNGEILIIYLHKLLRGSMIPGRVWLVIFSGLMYWLKNILAAVGCLVAIAKKQK